MQHTVELDNHLEQFLTDIATRLNKSKDDVLLIAINEYMQEKTRQAELEKEKQPSLLTDIIEELPKINTFKNDPVEIQRKIRNEWD